MLKCWVARLREPGKHPGLLSPARFDRQVRRLRRRNRRLGAALLLIEIDRLDETDRRFERSEVDRSIEAVASAAVAVATDCWATCLQRGIYLVYSEDVTRSVDIAEGIRASVAAASLVPCLTVTVGACVLLPRQDWLDGIHLAEDALLQGKQAGGNRVQWLPIAEATPSERAG